MTPFMLSTQITLHTLRIDRFDMIILVYLLAPCLSVYFGAMSTLPLCNDFCALTLLCVTLFKAQNFKLATSTVQILHSQSSTQCTAILRTTTKARPFHLISVALKGLQTVYSICNYREHVTTEHSGLIVGDSWSKQAP